MRFDAIPSRGRPYAVLMLSWMCFGTWESVLAIEMGCGELLEEVDRFISPLRFSGKVFG